MKKIILFTFFTITLLAGCTKKDVISNSSEVGISTVTYFAILTLKGNATLTIPLGTTFTDPGCTSKAGTSDLPVSVSGTVNTAVAGVYQLIYSSINKDGYSASAKRFVVVYATDASASANDFSGTYVRPSNGFLAIWTKIAPGVYSVFNPGGASGATLTVFVFNSTGLKIKIPSQVSSDGSITASSTETYTNSTPAGYSWIIVNSGYGAALRTFVKQ